MPEGPETKRMADDISRTVKQKEISSLKFLHPSLKSLNSKKGILVDDVTSAGKSIIIRLSTGQSIVTHNQLYGKWTINYLTTKIKHNRQLRIEIVSGKKVARLWSATDIVLLNSKDERIQDRDKKVVMTCSIGACAAIGGKLLKDMGFNDVVLLEGGVEAWKKSGYDIEK